MSNDDQHTPQYVGDDEQSWIAPVKGGEGLIEVGGVCDVLGDVDPLQGLHRGEGGVQGDAHVVDQERVHHEDRGQPHRDVSLTIRYQHGK